MNTKTKISAILLAAVPLGMLLAAPSGSTDKAMTIQSPKFGDSLHGESVEVVLNLEPSVDVQSLMVLLNGQDVSSRFSTLKAHGRTTAASASLLPADGLRSGSNNLFASVKAGSRGLVAASADFAFQQGVGATEGALQSHWLPPALGLKLNPGGAQPWVALTTGTPANLQDSIDQTVYSTPYPDTIFPLATDTPCTTQYQIVLLNRQTPAIEDGYMCAKDSSDLTSKLSSLANGPQKGAEIVLVGTTEGMNADSSLNTTSIGGTNYPAAAANLRPVPLGYAAIGVPGASAGTAYESLYVQGDIGKAYQTNPFAEGLLTKDQNNNYNFHPANNVQFEVYPNDPAFGGGLSSFYTSLNGGVFGFSAPQGSSNGFWLLVLDGVTLAPIDAVNASGSTCASSGGYCGTFYPTGSTDAGTASGAANALATALGNITSRQLVVLTTCGQPFQNGSAVTPNLQSAIFRLGGTHYTLQSLTTPTSTYTLVAPGLSFLAPASTPFSRGVVISSSAYSDQHQTGFVRGVMTRDNTSLYFPSQFSQEDGTANQTGAKYLSVNYDFSSIASQPKVDWPLTDTPGHIAAYHYASEVFTQNNWGYSGKIGDVHAADLRYYYTSTSIGKTSNLDFLPSNPQYPTYPGPGYGFTAQDLVDANAQLYQELTALLDAKNFLGDRSGGGLESLLFGGENSVADDAIAATYNILNNQFGATANTEVSVSAADWMGFLGGLTTLGSAVLGPLDLPIAAAVVGTASGVLATGAAWSPFATSDPASPPSYMNTFDTTLGQLQQNQSSYVKNLQYSYDSSLDAIYSDWAKLNAVFKETANSSSGWLLPDNVTSEGLATTFQNAIDRSMYIQVVPQFYQLDTFSAQPVSTLQGYGSLSFNGTYSCSNIYPASLSPADYAIYGHPGSSSTYDIYVMGGAINNDLSSKVSESLPTVSLLDILFGSSGLGIPKDEWFTMLSERRGPDFGYGSCYKIGCTSGPYGPNVCVGP